jgi:hypothetical protein
MSAKTYSEDAADHALRAPADWNTADYLSDDELAQRIAERPPFATETHRLLSTIIKLRKGVT